MDVPDQDPFRHALVPFSEEYIVPDYFNDTAIVLTAEEEESARDAGVLRARHAKYRAAQLAVQTDRAASTPVRARATVVRQRDPGAEQAAIDRANIDQANIDQANADQANVSTAASGTTADDSVSAAGAQGLDTTQVGEGLVGR